MPQILDDFTEFVMTRLRFPNVLIVSLIAVLGACVSAAHAQSGQPSLVGQYGDWGVYSGSNGSNKVCFALSQPQSSETIPPNRPRDPIYLFVSTRPADNVRDEVSVIVGYPLKSGADASAEVGDARFDLMTQGDNAWVKNASEEPRLVDAMRRGVDMIVKGVSTRGTQTIDKFSLRGISQALDRIGQECR